jgi:hypothetical protein
MAISGCLEKESFSVILRFYSSYAKDHIINLRGGFGKQLTAPAVLLQTRSQPTSFQKLAELRRMIYSVVSDNSCIMELEPRQGRMLKVD